MRSFAVFILATAGMSKAMCAGTFYDIKTVEDGVFELRVKHGLTGEEPEVDHWHVDQMRCLAALATRTGPQTAAIGCH